MSCYAVSIFMVTLLDLHRRPSSNEDFRRLGRAVSGMLLSIFYKKNKAKSKSESVSFQASFHLDPMIDSLKIRKWRSETSKGLTPQIEPNPDLVGHKVRKREFVSSAHHSSLAASAVNVTQDWKGVIIVHGDSN